MTIKKTNEIKFKRGEVYYFNLPDTNTHVQSGVRPCVIVSNNKGNKFSPTLIIVPITTKTKKSLPTHLKIDEEDYIEGVGAHGLVLCETIITIDKINCIVRLVGKLCEQKMKFIDMTLKLSIGLI